MAEIKIEKKKPIWPWILLVVILLAAVAYFVFVNNEDGDYSDDVDTEEFDDLNSTTYEDTTTYDDTADYQNSGTVLMTYSESIKDSTRIGTDTTYTKTALHNLSKAVAEKASKYNLESSKALEDLKQYSMTMDTMANNSMETTSGTNLKTVSDQIVTVLQSIQIKHFPDLQNIVTDLKQTSTKINATALDKQQTTLQAFFRKANDVLNNMNS